MWSRQGAEFQGCPASSTEWTDLGVGLNSPLDDTRLFPSATTETQTAECQTPCSLTGCLVFVGGGASPPHARSALECWWLATASGLGGLPTR